MIGSSATAVPTRGARAARWAIPAVLLAACSGVVGQVQRESRLREALDAHEFQEPLSVVWLEARKLLWERQYPLAGRDRAAVGAPPESIVTRFTRGGFETRPSGKSGLVLETREDKVRVRYRAEGTSTGEGASRLVFVAVRRTGGSPSEERSRDLELEIELIQRLEPQVAERILAAAR